MIYLYLEFWTGRVRRRQRLGKNQRLGFFFRWMILFSSLFPFPSSLLLSLLLCLFSITYKNTKFTVTFRVGRPTTLSQSSRRKQQQGLIHPSASTQIVIVLPNRRITKPNRNTRNHGSTHLSKKPRRRRNPPAAALQNPNSAASPTCPPQHHTARSPNVSARSSSRGGAPARGSEEVFF